MFESVTFSGQGGGNFCYLW